MVDLRFSSEELDALAVLRARVDAEPLLRNIPTAILARFLLACGLRVPHALERLRKREEKRRSVWRWDEVSTEEADALLDSVGYWQLSGRTDEGYATTFLVQREAKPPDSFGGAAAGLMAAHRFFLSAVSDADSCRDGLLLVLVLSGVPPSRLLAPPNKHMMAIGDGYTAVMPVRVRRILIVDAGAVLRVAVRAIAKAQLKPKLRERIEFLTLEQLGAIVPRRHWPVSLQSQQPEPTAATDAAATSLPPPPPPSPPPPPVAQTSAIIGARLAAFDGACEALTLPPLPSASERPDLWSSAVDIDEDSRLPTDSRTPADSRLSCSLS